MEAGRGPGGGGTAPFRMRRGAVLLLAAPAAAMLAVAAMASAHDASTEPDIPPCSFGYVPPHQGYREEIRALVSREGWPVWRDVYAHPDEWLYGYVENNSRAKSRLGVIYAMSGPGERTGEGMRAAVTVVVENQFAAPPGGCVWEHEYIAWGGNLSELEYDRGRKCYLADGRFGSPAPYELADEQTRLLVERAGPAPPDEAGALEYVRQNTRVDMAIKNHMTVIEREMDRTGWNAYRAIKVLNVNYHPQATGCLMEQAWINSGRSLSGLDYSEEARCYVAPAWDMDDGVVIGVCNGARLGDWRLLAPHYDMEDLQGAEGGGG